MPQVNATGRGKLLKLDQVICFKSSLKFCNLKDHSLVTDSFNMFRHFSILLTLNLILLSTNIFSANECKINLLWGHGGAGNVKDRIMELGITGRSIYQGCGVGGSGDIKYQVWQTGYNGNWMGHSSLLDNGGFNPIMSTKARAILDQNSTIDDHEQLKLSEPKYVDYEDSWANSLASKIDKVSQRDLLNGVMSSGFSRLTQYHWAAIMKEAADLINSEACVKVKIHFICHDESFFYHDDLGNLVSRKDLDDRVYSKRITQGKFDHIQIDKSLLVDSNGNSAVFKQQTCFDNGSDHIDNIPLNCSESHEIDKNVINAYENGPCGEFLSKVTNKYKKTRILDGRAEIFSLEKKSNSMPINFESNQE